MTLFSFLSFPVSHYCVALMTEMSHLKTTLKSEISLHTCACNCVDPDDGWQILHSAVPTRHTRARLRTTCICMDLCVCELRLFDREVRVQHALYCMQTVDHLHACTRTGPPSNGLGLAYATGSSGLDVTAPRFKSANKKKLNWWAETTCRSTVIGEGTTPLCTESMALTELRRMAA